MADEACGPAQHPDGAGRGLQHPKRRQHSRRHHILVTTSSSIATAGPVPFVTEARAMTFGTKDLAAASDEELLRLGKVVCDGLGIEGLGFGRVVQRLVQSEAHPTTEARAFIRSAVPNLCPEHASAIR